MFARVLPFALAVLWFVSGCEKTDHDSIDKWVRTEKGPGKLKTAVGNEDLDADLSAHAAENLIKMGQEADVRSAFEKMSPGRRTLVVGKLAPRLWNDARIEDEKKLPGAAQISAKDGLVTIRKWADESQKQQIDSYLTDWYAVTSYEGRAPGGQYTGATVVRMIGPSIAKKLIDVLNGVIAAPGQEKSKYRIGDELMLALAASGSPEAVKKLLDVARMDRGDKTLATRAMMALYTAYIDPNGLFDIVGPEPLVQNLDGIVAIAKDDTQPGKVINTAIDLIRAIGAPACLAPLVGMVGTPHKESRFKYVAANNALRCGGTKSIVEVVKALPEGGAYIKDELTGAIAGEIAKMTPRDQVLAACRQLLAEKSTIAKWTAIEALAAMKSVEDKPRIAALAKNKEKLTGYWGEDAEGKQDPTLGQRAKELADQLGGAAPAPEHK
ncbi:MAG TPA: hypothetical protein VFQ53_42840 [Kofleriaceae bacterium]|nr:hypothetical protein [Kofleriaceae bacterium]